MEDTKKVQRKCKRFIARLRAKGIICTDCPSQNIVICNKGQANGLDKSTVLGWLNKYCTKLTVPKFIAEKGQTHSFLVFKTVEEANKFYDTCNTKILDDGTPLYMSYVIEAPDTEIIINEPDPPGLVILNDFITAEEEETFLKLFHLTKTEGAGSLKNREVQHYGYEFRYGSNDVDLNSPLAQKIPKECDVLWSRLKSVGFDLPEPDQLTVNTYYPGQGIPSHVDKHSPFGPTILSLSLGSTVVMEWKHYTGKVVPVVVKERSMLVMQEEARYEWQHGIYARMYDPVIKTEKYDTKEIKIITDDTVPRSMRVSLTFRWTRSGPCECNYSIFCDSGAAKGPIDNIRDVSLASNIERVHVHEVYEQIASHFSVTRFKPWPQVLHFLQRATIGDVVLDLGCGNGKNLLETGAILQLACEYSSGLLAECKAHIKEIDAADCVRLDLLHAPLRDACADYIICVAVIHHFSSKARRLQSILTIARLLRPGGRALITVWSKDQKKSNYLSRNKQEIKHTEESWTTVGGLNLPVHKNRTQFKHSDILVPWKLRPVEDDDLADQPTERLLRFYHVFDYGELEELCKECIHLKVEESFYDDGNWCVICRKL